MRAHKKLSVFITIFTHIWSESLAGRVANNGCKNIERVRTHVSPVFTPSHRHHRGRCAEIKWDAGCANWICLDGWHVPHNARRVRVACVGADVRFVQPRKWTNHTDESEWDYAQGQSRGEPISLGRGPKARACNDIIGGCMRLRRVSRAAARFLRADRRFNRVWVRVRECVYVFVRICEWLICLGAHGKDGCGCDGLIGNELSR